MKKERVGFDVVGIGIERRQVVLFVAVVVVVVAVEAVAAFVEPVAVKG